MAAPGLGGARSLGADWIRAFRAGQLSDNINAPPTGKTAGGAVDRVATATKAAREQPARAGEPQPAGGREASHGTEKDQQAGDP